MDEIIFKDSKGKVKMKLKDDELIIEENLKKKEEKENKKEEKNERSES